jgi:hypothetical protein
MRRFSLPLTIILLALILGLAGACREIGPIVGQWRVNGPSNLLFEYRVDGTVCLVEGTRTFQVFHYQLKENSIIHLYDGMGRLQTYRYRIDGDKMTYYQANGSEWDVKESFTRVK